MGARWQWAVWLVVVGMSVAPFLLHAVETRLARRPPRLSPEALDALRRWR
jgi:hypothetical protein